MTTEVSGRITDRSVLEPFSAHRASTRLKVGPNQGPTAPQGTRKAPRGAGTTKNGAGTWRRCPGRARYRPVGPGAGGRRVTTTTKGEGAGSIARAPAP